MFPPGAAPFNLKVNLMAEIKPVTGRVFEGQYEGWEVEFPSGLVLFASRIVGGEDTRYIVSVSDGVDTTEIGYIASENELLPLAEAIEKIVSS